MEFVGQQSADSRLTLGQHTANSLPTRAVVLKIMLELSTSVHVCCFHLNVCVRTTLNVSRLETGKLFKPSLVSVHFLMALTGRIMKDRSNFHLVIMSLILVTFSLDLCIDTARRNLVLVTLGAERVKVMNVFVYLRCTSLLTDLALHIVGKLVMILKSELIM